MQSVPTYSQNDGRVRRIILTLLRTLKTIIDLPQNLRNFLAVPCSFAVFSVVFISRR
jgi:hypothetical protein